jgi:beta-mannosidase
MLVHQKAVEGNFKLTDGLLPHLRLPASMDDWHWAMQLNQAAAISTATDWFRSLAPHCSGSIVWQLNDCWPVTSWAAVDGEERAKPMLFALRDAHAPRRVLIQPSDPTGPDKALVVVVSNDSPDPWDGELVLDRIDFEGRVLAHEVTPVSVEPRSSRSVIVPSELAHPADVAGELIRAQIGSTRGLWFFAEYRDSALSPDRFTASLASGDDGEQLLTVTSEVLMRDVTLLVDKVEPLATVDRALVTLLPGESTTFAVRAPVPLTLDDLVHRSVLRTANQLVADSRT